MTRVHFLSEGARPGSVASCASAAPWTCRAAGEDTIDVSFQQGGGGDPVFDSLVESLERAMHDRHTLLVLHQCADGFEFRPRRPAAMVPHAPEDRRVALLTEGDLRGRQDALDGLPGYVLYAENGIR